MPVWLLASYILIWPILSLGVLAVLCIGLYRDIRQARRDGTELV